MTRLKEADAQLEQVEAKHILLEPDEWGLPPLHKIIHLGDRPIESYDQRFLLLLHDVIVSDVDGSYRSGTDPDEDRPLIEIIDDEQAAAKHRELFIQTVVSSIRNKQTREMIPLWGMYYMLGELSRAGVPKENMFPLFFRTGTGGTQTGTHEGLQLVGRDQSDLVDSRRCTLSVDDVLDSFNSEMRSAQFVLLARGENEKAEELGRIIADVKTHRDFDDPDNFWSYNDERMRQLYGRGIALVIVADVVYFSEYIKNETGYELLEKHAGGEPTADGIVASEDWQSGQLTALASMRKISADSWIIGMGMDTKVFGWQPDDSDRPYVMQYIWDERVKTYLEQSGIQHISFRVLSTLPYLGDFKGSVAQLTAYVARKLETRILRDVFSSDADHAPAVEVDHTIYAFSQA